MNISQEKFNEVKQVFTRFVSAEIKDIECLTSGNVNDTYKINAVNPTHEYILQKMNVYAYSSPVSVMENALLISEHLKKVGFNLKTPEYYGNIYCEKMSQAKRKISGSSVNYWRLCDFIDSVTYNKTTNIAIVKVTAAAFGHFGHALRNYNSSQLNIVIPDFHDTQKRYNRMLEALKRSKVMPSYVDDKSVACFESGEVSYDGILSNENTISIENEIVRIIDYLASVRPRACVLTNLQYAGRLPLRVVHNDTKINNVLFEKGYQSTGIIQNNIIQNNKGVQNEVSDINYQDVQNHPHPIAIIDLDTCMPGLVAHDFGDGIRYAAGIESDGRMTFNMDNFKAFCEGFIPEVAGYLTQEEKDTLYLAPFSMTIELAVRYLTDFFEGNKYFHIDYPLQNLDKARKQIELARQMYEKEENIREFVSEVLNKATSHVTQ